MSDFMPLERIEFGQFGALTALDISENSVIVLELKPDWQLSPADTLLLRQRCQAIFPENPVMVVDPGKLSLNVYDMPKTHAQAEVEAQRDRVRAVWTTGIVAVLCIQVARSLRNAWRLRSR